MWWPPMTVLVYKIIGGIHCTDIIFVIWSFLSLWMGSFRMNESMDESVIVWEHIFNACLIRQACISCCSVESRFLMTFPLLILGFKFQTHVYRHLVLALDFIQRLCCGCFCSIYVILVCFKFDVNCRWQTHSNSKQIQIDYVLIKYLISIKLLLLSNFSFLVKCVPTLTIRVNFIYRSCGLLKLEIWPKTSITTPYNVWLVFVSTFFMDRIKWLKYPYSILFFISFSIFIFIFF